MALTFTLAFDTTSVFWGGERCDRRWSEVEDGLDVLGTVGVPIRCQRWFSFRWSWNLPPVNVKYWQQPRGPGSPDVGPDLLGETGTLMIDEPQRLIHQVRRTGPDTAMSLPCGRRVLQPSYICQLTSVPRSTTPPSRPFSSPPFKICAQNVSGNRDTFVQGSTRDLSAVAVISFLPLMNKTQ